jgi:WD40 repeat protein
MDEVLRRPVSGINGGGQSGVVPPAPYPGLRPFEEDEWAIFFGRERLIHDIVERLTLNRIIAVHGISGCGKSSFVRAGVLPRLALECAREGWQWQTATIRPGNSPLWNLAVAVAQLKAGQTPSTEQIRAVRQLLNRGSDAFELIAEELALADQHQICILIDQFEELFRFAREIGPDEAELFADVICGFSAKPPKGFHLIITIRSDHLGDCAQFRGLAEEIVNKNQYLLPRLSDDELLRAVREPAALFRGEVKLDLAMRLLRDSEGEIDALPLIQHCLMRMWQEVEGGTRTVEQRQYHGLREGLSTHADEIVTEIVHDRTLTQRRVESAIELLFCALTAIDVNGRHIRWPQTFGHLQRVTGLDAATLNTVLRPFRAKSAGFVTPHGTSDLTEDDTIVDISHEALIRHWAKLAGSASQPGWTQREANEGQRYRALLEMLPGPLPFKTARKSIVWWNSRRPRTAAWASRYGGRFDEVDRMLLRSIVRYWVVVAAVAIAAFLGCYALWDHSEQLASNRREQVRAFYESGVNTLVRDGPARALLFALDGLKDPGLRLPPERLAYQALQNLHEKYIIEGREFSTPQVTFSPNSDLLLIAPGRQPIQLVNAQTGKTVAESAIPDSDSITGVKWITDGGAGKVLLIGRSGVYRLDRCPGSLAKALSCEQSKTFGEALGTTLISEWVRLISPDGRYAVSGAWNGQKAYLWDLVKKSAAVELDSSFNVAFNFDGSALALVLNNHIRIYDTAKRTSIDLPPAEELKGGGGLKAVAVAFGPPRGPAAGKLFTTAMGKARLWDIASQQSEDLQPALSSAWQAIFSPDGKAVAATLDNRQVQIWRLDTGEVTALQGHTGFVLSVDFSHDGRLVATGSSDGTARVWNLDAALGPQISQASTAELPGNKAHGEREVRNQDGRLTVVERESTIIQLNKTKQDWRAYGFVEDGVAAVTEDGRRYFWPVFADRERLIAFAQEQLPRCDDKPVVLSAVEKSRLSGQGDELRAAAILPGPFKVASDKKDCSVLTR